jgi:hypothetical protein
MPSNVEDTVAAWTGVESPRTDIETMTVTATARGRLNMGVLRVAMPAMRMAVRRTIVMIDTG